MLPYTAGEHRCSPPPRGAFASSLSPSAAPFPAADPAGPGRDLPTAPSVYAAAAAGDWGNASWIEPPVSYMAPVAASTATAPGYRGEPPHSTPYGIYSRIHFSDFPGLHPSISESSNLPSEKHPGTCQENSEALSNGAGQSFFHPQQDSVVSKFLGHSGAEDSGPYPPRQDLNQYPFGSSYDKYMTQLSSCSTDTQPHILSTRYVNPSEMGKRTGPVLNATTGESSFSSSSYMNPCRINLDYFDCVWNEQKDAGYKTTDKQYGKWSNSLDDMAAVGNYPLNSCVEIRAERLGNERPMEESSELKLDLGNFSSKFSSEMGFFQPREISSELPEVNNTSVDSPCWKGTPATYLSSFSIMENKDGPHTATGTVGYNSCYQSQKVPDLKFGYPAQFPECQEASGSENDLSKMFKLPMRFENSNNHVPPPIRVHDDASHASYLLNIQHARTQESNDPGRESKNVITSSQQESSCPGSKVKLLDQLSGSHTGSITEVISKKASSPIATSPRLHVDNLTSGSAHGNSSAAVEKEEATQKRGEDPSQCYPGAGGNVLNISSDSSSSTRAIFLKLMHNLSVVLLSTCKDGSVFQENEEEILQSVIQNLAAASSKRSKVLTALPDDKMLDDTKVSEASVYKNLWIEAEASACKLKYELQLARMNLATMKGHNNTLKAPYSSEGSKGSNSSMASSSKQQNLGEVSTQRQGGDSGNGQSPIVNRSTVYGVDDDVLARLKVLQSRTDNVCSFGELDCEGQQEASKKPYGVEDAVMARMQVLKSRPDNVTFFSQQSNPDASTNKAEDAVMDRLRILESRPNNVTFLGQGSSKHEVDAGTNKENVVDDAVIARLRILKSRPDNVTSMCGVSKEHEEACDDQMKRDGIEVMSSGLTVNVKQIAKFVQSFDLANRLERNDSTSGLDFVDGACARENNKASGSADVASPKRCEATPEETSNKGEVQGEDSLGGNQAWPQAAGDSNVCAEVSAPVQQHGSSPSEWEHVLKENFFHPGK
ncbi:hypothetical protein EJB05_23591 [Eragrostis curvula]|uniref:Uncharacterized protein n=1 Tax=Eragrostis curvula TaxID=38414 RepID=A0A5J9V7H6_9POAL|nr:hypothetical protein EJB05_23591 [Eragrostis curvula]